MQLSILPSLSWLDAMGSHKWPIVIVMVGSFALGMERSALMRWAGIFVMWWYLDVVAIDGWRWVLLASEVGVVLELCKYHHTMQRKMRQYYTEKVKDDIA